MEIALVSAADMHPGPTADCLQPAQNMDITSSIFIYYLYICA